MNLNAYFSMCLIDTFSLFFCEKLNHFGKYQKAAGTQERGWEKRGSLCDFFRSGCLVHKRKDFAIIGAVGAPS